MLRERLKAAEDGDVSAVREAAQKDADRLSQLPFGAPMLHLIGCAMELPPGRPRACAASRLAAWWRAVHAVHVQDTHTRDWHVSDGRCPLTASAPSMRAVTQDACDWYRYEYERAASKYQGGGIREWFKRTVHEIGTSVRDLMRMEPAGLTPCCSGAFASRDRPCILRAQACRITYVGKDLACPCLLCCFDGNAGRQCSSPCVQLSARHALALSGWPARRAPGLRAQQQGVAAADQVRPGALRLRQGRHDRQRGHRVRPRALLWGDKPHTELLLDVCVVCVAARSRCAPGPEV